MNIAKVLFPLALTIACAVPALSDVSSLTPLQLLPRVVVSGKTYTIRLRWTEDQGYPPYTVRFNTNHGQVLQKRIIGTDAKAGVIIELLVRFVLPASENVSRYDENYSFFVEDGHPFDNGHDLPENGRVFLVTVQGKPLKLSPVTVKSLVGRWRWNDGGRTVDDFEFLRDGSAVVYTMDGYPAGAAGGRYTLIGSNRLKLDVQGRTFLYRNVSVSGGRLGLFSESNNNGFTLQRVSNE